MQLDLYTPAENSCQLFGGLVLDDLAQAILPARFILVLVRTDLPRNLLEFVSL